MCLVLIAPSPSSSVQTRLKACVSPTTFLACLVLSTVLFAKLWLVWQLGNPTPFYDQWDAEAAFLYKPYLEGNLTWGGLFAAHNEHRLFTTRIFHLALFEIGGHRWNPVLQMVCNAFWHVAAIGVVLGFAQSVVPRSSAWPSTVIR